MAHQKVTLYIRITTPDGKRKMCKPARAARSGFRAKSRKHADFPELSIRWCDLTSHIGFAATESS